VTELEDSEKSLRESEERYRSIFDNSQVAILLTEPNGGNSGCQRIRLGCLAILKKKSVSWDGTVMLICRIPVCRFAGRKTKKRYGGRTVNIQNCRRQEIRGRVFSKIFTEKEGKEKTSMLIQDITDRMNSEEALRNSQQQFQSYFNSSAVD
jgi:PAS domain-containing protein